MDLANSFISLLGSYLEGRNLREKNKYTDKYLSLKKQYLNEISKPDDSIDTNSIDHILIELQLLSKAVTSPRE